MTHYWWMHWFWITYILQGMSTATLPQTIHPALATEPSSQKNSLLNQSIVKTISISTIPSTIPSVIPLSTLVPTNVTYKSTKKLKLLLSSVKNISSKIQNASKEVREKDLNSYKNNSTKTYNATKELKNKDLPVIKTNSTKQNVTEELNTVSPVSFQNETENVTCLGEELHWNLSLSERIGIEEDTANSETYNSNLSAAGITGITLGCVVFVGVLTGVSFFFYRYHRFNRPQVLNDRCSNPDSSGYIDDASVRDNSEEMYSLDNDSFLNSLEAMTIQNYWTDTVKHTKL